MSAVDVRSDKLGRLVDENVEVKQLGTGFTFTEGPVWNPQGQFLLFSDMPADTRRRWDEQGGVEVVASPSNKGNGMTLDADGRLIVCEHSTSSLVRMDPDGKDTGREVLASHYEGQELNSPNDVCVKLGRVDLVLRPLVRAHARLRARARARARLAGRLPRPARRR